MASREGGRRNRPFGRMLCVTSRDIRNSATTESSLQREDAPASGGAGSSSGSGCAAKPKPDDFASTPIKAASLAGDAVQRGGERIDIFFRIVKRERSANAALE